MGTLLFDSKDPIKLSGNFFFFLEAVDFQIVEANYLSKSKSMTLQSSCEMD